jgi:F-type H+-transporting ATPase subunit b
MDSTLKALGDLLLEAVPTIIFFLFLAWYLKRVFFIPLARILEERRKAVEGVKDFAQKAFEAADKKQSEFERALELARAEIYKEQEKIRRQWSEEQAHEIERARTDVGKQIEQARGQIAAEAQRAQDELKNRIDGLSENIVNSLLTRRAA